MLAYCLEKYLFFSPVCIRFWSRSLPIVPDFRGRNGVLPSEGVERKNVFAVFRGCLEDFRLPLFALPVGLDHGCFSLVGSEIFQCGSHKIGTGIFLRMGGNLFQ